jgi:hypothetical protein
MKTRIKIVPDDDPNSPGRWVDVETRRVSVKGWDALVAAYAEFVLPGFHIVAIDHHLEPEDGEVNFGASP